MGFCVVTATVNRAAAPWIGGVVWFTLAKGSYAIDAHYPSAIIQADVRPDGKAIAALWNNEEGFVPTQWQCQMPDGESFVFSIPVGLEEATLEYLRSLTSQPPPAPGLGAIINAAIVAHNADPLAHPGLGGEGGVPLPTLPAAIALSALRIVSGNGANYAYSNPADAISVWAIAGLTPSAISQGQPCTPIRNQPITDGAWNWDTSKPIFLGASGTLTQSPPTANWLVVIGRALSPQTLFIQIEEPTQL